MHSAQEFEATYWGDCANTFDEEQKHWVYARFMGLRQEHFSIAHLGGPVLDIGGGPCSMLLKVQRRGQVSIGTVVDPLRYPEWTRQRYTAHGVEVIVAGGEQLPLTATRYSEAWIYNCLQHVEDPALIIQNALKAAPVLRLCEWVDIPPHDGHPHMLTAAALDRWTGGRGAVVDVAESGCYGRLYSVVVDQGAIPVMAGAKPDAMDRT